MDKNFVSIPTLSKKVQYRTTNAGDSIKRGAQDRTFREVRPGYVQQALC